MGKVTRKRHTPEFKAKVALDAMKGEQTLAELGAKHGIHQTCAKQMLCRVIATWKRQAIDGLTGIFSGKPQDSKGAADKEKEVTQLHARDNQVVALRLASLWWNAIFWPRPPVDECRTEAGAGRAGAFRAFGCAAMRAFGRQPVGILLPANG